MWYTRALPTWRCCMTLLDEQNVCQRFAEFAPWYLMHAGLYGLLL